MNFTWNEYLSPRAVEKIKINENEMKAPLPKSYLQIIIRHSNAASGWALGREGFSPPRIWEQLTLFQKGIGADYAHHITAYPSEFESPTASLMQAQWTMGSKSFWSRMCNLSQNVFFAFILIETEMLLKNFVYEDPYVTSEIHCPHLVLMHVNLANISRGHEFFCKQQIVSNSNWKVRG